MMVDDDKISIEILSSGFSASQDIAGCIDSTDALL
jgi:hypothetical protein